MQKNIQHAICLQGTDSCYRRQLTVLFLELCMIAAMIEVGSSVARPRFQRSGVDRRDSEDRRQIHDLGYFDGGGMERRIGEERRESGEKRAGWVRISQWSSICVSSLVTARPASMAS